MSVYTTSSLFLFLLYGLIGAGSMWLLLRWVGQPYRVVHILLGAGGWVLGEIVSAIVYGLFVSFEPMMFTAAIANAALGLTGGFATAMTLKRADIELSSRTMRRSIIVWAVVFALAGMARQSALIYMGYDYAGIVEFALYPLAGVSGFAVLASGLLVERLQSQRVH